MGELNTTQTNDNFPVLRRGWWALAGLHGTMLAHLALYLAQPGKTDSRALLVMAAALAVFSIAVIGFTVWLNPARLNTLRSRLRGRFGVLLLAAGIGVTTLWGLVIRPEWLYAHVGLTLAATLALAYWSIDTHHVALLSHRRAWLGGAALVVIGVTLVRAYGATAYPYTQITDEGWHLGWVMSYLKTGHFSDWLMYYGGHDVQRFYLPMAWWLSIVGVGFWQARLFTLLLTFPMIYCSARAAQNFYGRPAALLTAGFLFASAVVMIAVRIRHDVGLGIAIALALWLHSAALKRDSRALHLLAGLAMGLGWFAHYHATGLGAALAIGLYAPRYVARWREGKRLPETGFWLFCLGGLIGAGIVVALQILPDWQGFLVSRQARNPDSLGELLVTTAKHINSIAVHSRFEFLLIALGLAAALWRRRPADVSIALTVILSHIALGAMATSGWDHYPMPLTPLYGLLVAGLFVDGFARLRPSAETLKRGTVIVFLCFVTVNLGLTVRVPLHYLLQGRPMQPPPPPAAAWVLENVDPKTALVEGEHYYFLWLYDYRYVSPLTPNFMQPADKARFPTFESIWDDIAPDIFILDPNLSTCCVLQTLVDSGYMQSRGYEIAAQFDGEEQPITIYRRVP